MDLWAVLVTLASGAALTWLGWMLSERSASGRQWNAEKKNSYARFLAAARQFEWSVKGLPEARTAWFAPEVLPGSPGWELNRETLERSSSALSDMGTGLAEILLLGRGDVIDRGTALLGASNKLVGYKPADETDWEVWSAALHAFQDACRDDLKIPW